MNFTSEYSNELRTACLRIAELVKDTVESDGSHNEEIASLVDHLRSHNITANMQTKLSRDAYQNCDIAAEYIAGQVLAVLDNMQVIPLKQVLPVFEEHDMLEGIDGAYLIDTSKLPQSVIQWMTLRKMYSMVNKLFQK